MVIFAGGGNQAFCGRIQKRVYFLSVYVAARISISRSIFFAFFLLCFTPQWECPKMPLNSSPFPAFRFVIVRSTSLGFTSSECHHTSITTLDDSVANPPLRDQKCDPFFYSIIDPRIVISKGSLYLFNRRPSAAAAPRASGSPTDRRPAGTHRPIESNPQQDPTTVWWNSKRLSDLLPPGIVVLQ